MKNPLLSVCLITYNHVGYIKNAIESVLMQKTCFNFELIIADDNSTDGTREILLEYQKKYPEVISLILQKENVGAAKNWIELISKPKSKYIAYFEGDDFWTDDHKLQLQVDFLEANPDFTISFHNADVINSDGTRILRRFNYYKKNTYSGEDILRQWLIPTASVVFRNILEKPLATFFMKSTHGDLALFLYLSQFGKIGYIDRIMSIYRINEHSVTQNSFEGIVHNELHIAQCKDMMEYFKPQYSRLLKERIAEYYCSTAFLYSRERNKKMAWQCLINAKNEDWFTWFKNAKYFAGTIFYILLP